MILKYFENDLNRRLIHNTKTIKVVKNKIGRPVVRPPYRYYSKNNIIT
jgi:hypothetical protein